MGIYIAQVEVDNNKALLNYLVNICSLTEKNKTKIKFNINVFKKLIYYYY